jgi:2,4-dienoyl-CoA reductase-like NADH-dependent reductase (Old Yellow Enzyme family)/thioredoxin reductase
MGCHLENRDASVSDANIAYISRQASGGIGLVITEITAVHETGALGIGAYDDRFVPGLAKMAQAIHQGGAKAALQLHHSGRENYRALKKGVALGPSAVPSLVYGMAPKEMTLDDIHMMITSFGQAAARAVAAGFDAVEIHGAHGYLLTQFLSAISNHRTDEYGGDFKRRARFMVEVVQEVRNCVGKDFPVILRVSAEEYIRNGYTIEEMQTILPELVEAGVDVFHASVGTHGSPGGVTSAPPEFEAGWNVWRAKKFKEVVDVPVIAVGRFSDPRIADQFIAKGDADMIAFGRQQLADPDFLTKAKAGQYDQIRVCIACNQGCIERLMFEPNASVRCAINPETGQELLYPRSPAKTPRKVWIVGAGPAGLTAAYEAARLGHKVSLFEKSDQAGGQLLYASKAPSKQIYGEWIAWLIKQVEGIGVSIQTHTLITPEKLEVADADAVILATGGDKIIPPIAGLDEPIACNAWQILGEEIKPGKNAVVVGGGLIGMETADFMSARGSQVTLVEMLPQSPVTKFSSHGYMLHKRLQKANCRMVFNARLDQIDKDAVTVSINEKQEVMAGVDQVVMAVGMKPRQDLKAYLKNNSMEHYIVGDAQDVRRIIEATDEGAKAAWKL